MDERATLNRLSETLGLAVLGEGRVSCVPPTPAEAAVDSIRWERRGLLGRLVPIVDPVPVVESVPADAARRAA